jgi:hypothetical protein
MTSNITRFYYDELTSDQKKSEVGGRVFEDLNRDEADCHEKFLQSKNIEYVRIDL